MPFMYYIYVHLNIKYAIKSRREKQNKLNKFCCVLFFVLLLKQQYIEYFTAVFVCFNCVSLLTYTRNN